MLRGCAQRDGRKFPRTVAGLRNADRKRLRYSHGTLLDSARRDAARFVDADPEHFMFVRNATSALRISAHIYNAREDYERLSAALTALRP